MSSSFYIKPQQDGKDFWTSQSRMSSSFYIKPQQMALEQ